MILTALGWVFFDLVVEYVWNFPAAGFAALSAALGALYGGLSLLFAPHYLIHNPSVRFWYVLLVPIALSLLMARLNALRDKDQRGFRVDYFVYAYIFTLAFVVARAAGVQ